MAQVNRIICGRKGCKREDATHYSTFYARRMDGAGDMEDWHLGFDLCLEHAAKLLEKALDVLGSGMAAALLKENNIYAREE